MKIINQIAFIIAIIIIIFIIKNDYKQLYSKTFSYLQSEINTTNKFNNKLKELVDSINNSKITTTVKSSTSEAVPGALIVSNEYLSTNIKDIKLSKDHLIEITNKYRKELGDLPPLTENSKLDFSSEKKLQDMFMKNYFEHISPDNIGVGDLGTQVGYDYILIGENLALGNFKSDEALMDAWMASPGHKANIMNKNYSEIGISVGKGIYNGNSIWMAVQHFGLPKSACPIIDGVLKGIIDINQTKVKELENNLINKKTKIESGAINEGTTTSEQINDYNNLVTEYNKFILEIKSQINKYNTGVKNFNTCVARVNI